MVRAGLHEGATLYIGSIITEGTVTFHGVARCPGSLVLFTLTASPGCTKTNDSGLIARTAAGDMARLAPPWPAGTRQHDSTLTPALSSFFVLSNLGGDQARRPGSLRRAL